MKEPLKCNELQSFNEFPLVDLPMMSTCTDARVSSHPLWFYGAFRNIKIVVIACASLPNDRSEFRPVSEAFRETYYKGGVSFFFNSRG